MRRFTLGLLILGGGTLLSLPFRRVSLPDPSSLSDRGESRQSSTFDDDALRLLVHEVTQGVEVPVVFDPHTDFSPSPQSEQMRQLPLTYEDLAVPVDHDPFYQNRFNAALQVAQRTADAEQERRLAELERLFTETEYVDQSIAGLSSGGLPPQEIPVQGKRWTYQNAISEAPSGVADGSRSGVGAQLASSDSAGKPEGGSRRGEASILAKLPPPSDVAERSENERTRHWIQQPD